jgi:hypothetical protein
MMKPQGSPVKKITVYKSEGSAQTPNTPPATMKALREHGIQRHLLDSVRAPDAVMSVLCNTGGLHNAFVGSAETFVHYDSVLNDPRLKQQLTNRKWQHVLSRGCFTPSGRFSASFSFHGRQPVSALPCLHCCGWVGKTWLRKDLMFHGAQATRTCCPSRRTIAARNIWWWETTTEVNS